MVPASQPPFRRSLSCFCVRGPPGGLCATGTITVATIARPEGRDLIGRALTNVQVNDPRSVQVRVVAFAGKIVIIRTVETTATKGHAGSNFVLPVFVTK